MKEEIKEMLDNLKDEVWSKTGADSYDKLLDYIINLQEENERLRLELSGYREAILRNDKMLGLQQRIDKMLGLQQRIDKAIKYIKENNFHYMNEYALERFTNDLSNILRGKNE